MTSANVLKPATICLFTTLLPLVTSWIPQVINGRPRGGMLKAPDAPPGTPLPPENWFEFQRLDHFSARDHSWWKQVNAHFFYYCYISREITRTLMYLPHFTLGATLKGKNLLPEGANSFL